MIVNLLVNVLFVLFVWFLVGKFDVEFGGNGYVIFLEGLFYYFCDLFVGILVVIVSWGYFYRGFVLVDDIKLF